MGRVMVTMILSFSPALTVEVRYSLPVVTMSLIDMGPNGSDYLRPAFTPCNLS